jgi:hypothetical protein
LHVAVTHLLSVLQVLGAPDSQWPVDGLHLSSVQRLSSDPHVIGVYWHCPVDALHVPTEQRLSIGAGHSFGALDTHCPVSGLHVSVVQRSPSPGQSMGGFDTH